MARGCTHHEGLDGERHFVLRSERRPFRVLAEGGKDLVPVSAVAIGQHPHQRVWIIELLPDRDDFCTVFFEERDLALTEALVQIVDAALAVARRLSRVDAQLEAARVGRDVAGELGWKVSGRAAGRRRAVLGTRDATETKADDEGKNYPSHAHVYLLFDWIAGSSFVDLLGDGISSTRLPSRSTRWRQSQNQLQSADPKCLRAFYRTCQCLRMKDEVWWTRRGSNP